MSDQLCFVIAPIGEAESETRKRSDQILKHVIIPATSSCGYKALRADQISEPGMITSQVIQHIVEDPLVVADLTDRNPNVFYELAIRHAIRKPLVQIIKKGEQIPFDVAGTRTVHVDHRDLDSVEDAKREIVAQIRALEKDPSKLETPISVSLDLQTLRQSDSPEQRSLADVLSALTEIRASVANLDNRLSHAKFYDSETHYSREMLRNNMWIPGTVSNSDCMNNLDRLRYLLLSTEDKKSCSKLEKSGPERYSNLKELIEDSPESDTP